MINATLSELPSHQRP